MTKTKNVAARFKMKPLVLLCLALGSLAGGQALGQKTYYIDGYHGGVWGHYPDWNTRFMADQLKSNPYWRINIELEPETWDRAKMVDSAAYNDFKSLFADQSVNGRIEYTNPSYAQSYLYNLDGESIIRQFYYGIQKVKSHFPTAAFTTYAVEEPCFTSALPQILQSFGFKYASLKNPNTCFGGYTRAHGGELVNWIGPDGTGITTVPRYSIESLLPASTWQTIAWDNSPAYINAALKDGIQHPIGMTYQDAGWKGGPFLKGGRQLAEKNIYTTWRNYFATVVAGDAAPNWQLSQEDIQVSLVWGSQVMQNIARQVRQAENNILQAEKMAAMASIYTGMPWPKRELDGAWRTLLLAQHHDSWIVPYNGRPGDTWADKVRHWTDHTNAASDSIIAQSTYPGIAGNAADEAMQIRVYNTLGRTRQEVVILPIPKAWIEKGVRVVNSQGHAVNAQVLQDTSANRLMVAFTATCPSMGYNTYRVERQPTAPVQGMVKVDAQGRYHLESDLYSMTLDPKQGGVIQQLIAKKLGNKEFVDQQSNRGFNELRGNFYEEGGFKSSREHPASVQVLEDGPLVAKLMIKGIISQYPFSQIITLTKGQSRIDIDLTIDWKGNPRIGEPTPPGTYKIENYHKAFYNDRYKLLSHFPLNLKSQKVYKSAPFDVTLSKLDNTFFSTWDRIKNNVVTNWVDVTDGNESYGLALLTDHTTNYAHGKNFPLSLDVQYAGMGLWGKDHTITGPSHLRYALIPHEGRWDKAAIWSRSEAWNQPLIASLITDKTATDDETKSILQFDGTGLQVTAMLRDGDDLVIRLFNAESRSSQHTIKLNLTAKQADIVELDGRMRQHLQPGLSKGGQMVLSLDIPQFGIRTIKLTSARYNGTTKI
ncbi:glycoside hydrolase family 38 C-terminal domain-containing protein [Mucilaginibacter lacusdianchii]|uniref:glycoside hydrolase family 38 C-terminal domain-containing protein n=1 Tax=Mucilaginibacter lacusdianchii TaxID=2684211 RepID=UPI00131B94D7|nr:glycoside hydrolase family 38 C-terminal domain-containing protein [Mucilaginibacter sp. JXJ CY 39]